MLMPVADDRILARKDEIVRLLQRAVLDGVVIADPSETKVYECDAYTAYTCVPLAVVLPSTTQEVAAVLRVCHEQGVPVIPRGSGTSLTGGALPTADSVVVGLSRMANVLEIDIANRFIRVETGCTNMAVSKFVEQAGFFYAPDPSSQIACAIGGNIATNAGGAHCLKYGVTSNNLLGVTFVSIEGEIIEFGGPFLDAAGLDLLGIICGSEGQLGVVTEATLRILPSPENARPVLFGFESSEQAGRCVSDIIRSGTLPVAIEFMDRLVIRATDDFAKANYPDTEALLIVEVEGSVEEIEAQLAKIVAIATSHGAVSIRQSRSAADSASIWKGRKSAFGAMGRLGDYICLDGVIPVSKLAVVLMRIAELAETYGLKVGNVFHAGDGNLHPLILFDENLPGQLEKAEALGAEILRLCVDVGGCLTGEHGVGVEKRELMSLQFSAEDLDVQMSVKEVFDPAWRLNPAKVFPLAVSTNRRLIH